MAEVRPPSLYLNRDATSALGIYKLVSYQSLHVRQIDVCFVSFEIVLYSLLSSVDNEIDMSYTSQESKEYTCN